MSEFDEKEFGEEKKQEANEPVNTPPTEENTTYHYVDTSNLPLSLRLRFGYAPLKWCPALYRFQMRLFTHLRLFLGMDKGRY